MILISGKITDRLWLAFLYIECEDELIFHRRWNRTISYSQKNKFNLVRSLITKMQLLLIRHHSIDVNTLFSISSVNCFSNRICNASIKLHTNAFRTLQTDMMVYWNCAYATFQSKLHSIGICTKVFWAGKAN